MNTGRFLILVWDDPSVSKGGDCGLEWVLILNGGNATLGVTGASFRAIRGWALPSGKSNCLLGSVWTLVG